MGKHVQVEIPMALSLADSQRLVALQRETGLVCMVAHTRRYSKVMREIWRRVKNRDLTLHQVVFETYFFRRVNINRFGQPRTWTDDLLWHHACHIVDYVYWLFDEPDMAVWGQVGPNHPELGIPMDLSIGMRSKSGCLVTTILSFNNHGPITIKQRYIGEEETLRIEKGALYDHEDRELMREDFEQNFVTQNLEFFDAVSQGREPLTSIANCLPVMAILDRIQSAVEFCRQE